MALKRNNFSAEVIDCLAEAHRLLYRAKVGLDHAWEILRANGQLVPQVNHLSQLHPGSAGRPPRPRPRTQEGGVKKLRLAVVGAGRLGGFHAQKLAALPAVELVAVADPLAARRNALAAQCHTQAVADARELAGQVDAVVIAAPTRLHHALGMDFLRQGVHVLVEKPLAATAGEADELVETARRAGVVLQVGHVERFNPAFAAALPRWAARSRSSPPSTSRPCGAAPSPSARPTSAWCWT